MMMYSSGTDLYIIRVIVAVSTATGSSRRR
jgi:hypothetical protein